MFNTTTTGPNLQQVLKEAQQELNAEKLVKAKSRIKDKLKQIDSAKQILSNFEREYADLVQQIADGN